MTNLELFSSDLKPANVLNALETLTREILKGHSFASIANIDRELGHSLEQALKAIGTARHKSITGTDWMSVLES